MAEKIRKIRGLVVCNGKPYINNCSVLHQDESNLWKKDIKLKDVRWFKQCIKSRAKTVKLLLQQLKPAGGSLWYRVYHRLLNKFSILSVKSCEHIKHLQNFFLFEAFAQHTFVMRLK